MNAPLPYQENGVYKQRATDRAVLGI